MRGHKPKSMISRNFLFFFRDVTLLHLKPQAQKQFLRRVCLQKMYEHVRRLFSVSFLILILIVLSTLKRLHKIPSSFTFNG